LDNGLCHALAFGSFQIRLLRLGQLHLRVTEAVVEALQQLAGTVHCALNRGFWAAQVQHVVGRTEGW